MSAELRLVVMILATVYDGLGSVIAVLKGDATLERARRDVKDALERETKRLEFELWTEQQVAKGPLDDDPDPAA